MAYSTLGEMASQDKTQAGVVTLQETTSEKSTGVGVDESRDGFGLIADEDRGTVQDLRDMMILGKKQVLRRNFRFVTMFGLASTVMASWECLLPLFAWSLIDGGTALLFWGFVACIVIFLLVYASIAEIASISPTAGGQYHYVSELAPPSTQKFLSYTVGWLTTMGWQMYLAGICFITALLVQGVIALNVENYVWHNWHGTLLVIACILFGVMFNSIFAAQLPIISEMTLVLHFIGPFAICITLWCTAPRADSHIALFEFTNNGGWPSLGLSAMAGIITPFCLLTGYDCSVHMSEEIRDASLTLPRALMASVVLNATLDLFLIATLVFTMGDINDINQTSTGQPFIQVVLNATHSYAATNVLLGMVIILLAAACIREVATSSRQIWSFARDGGLPGSVWLAHFPLRAISTSVLIVSLLACINLGSTAALNAIISLGAVSILTSYYVTIGCLIFRRLRGPPPPPPPLPPRRWSLGRWGLPVNVAALALLTPLWFFAFWPLAVPVRSGNMNWSSVMFGGTVLGAGTYYWGWARWVYEGPVVFVKRDL